MTAQDHAICASAAAEEAGRYSPHDYPDRVETLCRIAQAHSAAALALAAVDANRSATPVTITGYDRDYPLPVVVRS